MAALRPFTGVISFSGRICRPDIGFCPAVGFWPVVVFRADAACLDFVLLADPALSAAAALEDAPAVGREGVVPWRSFGGAASCRLADWLRLAGLAPGAPRAFPAAVLSMIFRPPIAFDLSLLRAGEITD